MALGTIPYNPNDFNDFYHHVWDLQSVTTVSSSGTLLPETFEEPMAGLGWNEIRWAITGPEVTWQTFKTEDEALQKAKLVAGKADRVEEVIVMKVVCRVRPVPKEVEVVEVKD